MNKTRKITAFLLLIIILISNFSNIFAKTIAESEKINLVFGHDCVSVLKLKGKDVLKQVSYVYYEDPDTHIKYPAFCVEPDKEGIGTGAGNSYDVFVSQLDDPVLWRMLYYGYVGSTYQSWGLACDDDLYFATKTAVHCYADGSTPTSKYEIPTRLGRGDETRATLAEVQARGAQVLQVAQKIYDDAINNTNDNYIKASVTISKDSQEETTLNGTKYLVQNYTVTANKELSSYNVAISDFPEGTRILNSSNVDSTSMTNSTLKIAIPVSTLLENFTGYVSVYNAKVKSFPIFYGNSGNTSTQNYVFTDPSETTTALTPLNVDVYKSSLKIIKEDAETKTRIPNVVFNFKYANGENIGNYTTDANGEITITNLKQGTIIATEIETNEDYILDKSAKEINIGYAENKVVSFTNERKRGNLEVYKVDKDNNKITLGNVKFDLFSYEKNKVIGTYNTDVNGRFYIENLRVGNYSLIEKETNKWYNLAKDTNIQVKWNEENSVTVENELKKGQVKIIKVDNENNEIKLSNVKFGVYDENNNLLETIVTNNDGEALTQKYPIRDFETLKLVELETNEYYVLNNTPQTITLEENQISTIKFENEKKKGQIKVIKVDLDNNEVKIPNVEFKVYDENGNVVDTLKTNENGEATTKRLPIDQEYKVQETKTGKWYVLNDEMQTVTLEQDKITNLTFTNEKKKGQLRVIKVDLDDNVVLLEGVTFDILDENGNVVDTVKTNENGEATTKRLPIDEQYTVVEKETRKEYVLTKETQTVELTQDEITSITFENEKIKGFVEVTKIDSKTKDTLKGAKFGIYNENNEEIGQLETSENGIATSELIPYGKYYLKELETGSPYYLLNENTYKFEITEDGKTVSIAVENEPVDIEVTVDKEGTTEIKPGDMVDYEFSNVGNNSNVYLENFKWFDYIPTDYIRLENMTTGTWNQDLTYSVYYKTNKTDDYILFKEGLSTNENYNLDFTKVELAEDEYITETMYDFGTVDVGFKESTSPTMRCKSIDTLQEGDTFTNHTKTVGVYFGITAESNSKWTTITHIPEEKHEVTLPRTGK